MFEQRARIAVPSWDGSSDLPEGRAAHLAAPCEVNRGRWFRCPARHHLLSEGDIASSVFLISSGDVMLSKALPDGRRQVLELLGPDDVFGLSDGDVYDAFAETFTSAVIL